jgi:hypothetical protein
MYMYCTTMYVQYVTHNSTPIATVQYEMYSAYMRLFRNIPRNVICFRSFLKVFENCLKLLEPWRFRRLSNLILYCGVLDILEVLDICTVRCSTPRMFILSVGRLHCELIRFCSIHSCLLDTRLWRTRHICWTEHLHRTWHPFLLYGILTMYWAPIWAVLDTHYIFVLYTSIPIKAFKARPISGVLDISDLLDTYLCSTERLLYWTPSYSGYVLSIKL